MNICIYIVNNKLGASSPKTRVHRDRAAKKQVSQQLRDHLCDWSSSSAFHYEQTSNNVQYLHSTVFYETILENLFDMRRLFLWFHCN